MRVFGYAAYSLTGGNLRLFQVVFEFFPSTHRHVHVLAMDGMHGIAGEVDHNLHHLEQTGQLELRPISERDPCCTSVCRMVPGEDA